MKHGILITTTSQLDGWQVDEYLGPVSSQFVIGTGLFTDYFASWTDLFGAHSRSYQDKLERINTEALEMIAERAHRLRANVVLGLRVDHDEISGSGKSMLMVTASGTAARATRTSARKGEDANDGGMMPAARYRALRARQEIIAAARAGSIDWMSPEVWRSLLDQQIHEVSDDLLAFLDARIRSGRPDEEDAYTNRVADYYESLPHETAVPLLYRALRYVTPLAHRALQVLKDLDGFEPDIIREILMEPSNALQRARSLSAVQGDLPYYRATDRARITALADMVPTSFAPADVHEEKGLIHKRRAWTCVNGHAVSAKEDYCGSCTADRRGFEHGFLTPEEATQELLRKLELLDQHFGTGRGPVDAVLLNA
jgi:uncharacterized protein YbjQ (UPF0145 family)